MDEAELPVIRPHRLRVGPYRFWWKWGNWGCDRQGWGGVAGFGSPLAAFRALRRVRRERIAEGQRALYREQVAKCGSMFEAGQRAAAELARGLAVNPRDDPS